MFSTYDWSRRGSVIAVAALVVLALGTTAALGQPLERERYHESGAADFEDFCEVEGLTIREAFEEYINVTFNQRGADRLAYFTGTIHGVITWTNLANGKTLRQVYNFVDKDHTVTDNGDGTLTLTVLQAGGARIYGPDGKLLFRDPGQTRFQLLIDHAGTPDYPFDDEVIDFLGVVKGSTGRNDLEGRDFCQDIQTFIG